MTATLTQELLRLVDQSLWANRQWVEYVYSQPNPERRPRELLSHILLGEHVWFERIDGQQRTTDTFALRSKAELLRGFEENAAVFRQLIAARLEDVVDFKRASGEEYHARVMDIIHHLLTHGYHHRGQLASHYARAGVSYPSLDHIDYLIQNKL